MKFNINDAAIPSTQDCLAIGLPLEDYQYFRIACIYLQAVSAGLTEAEAVKLADTSTNRVRRKDFTVYLEKAAQYISNVTQPIIDSLRAHVALQVPRLVQHLLEEVYKPHHRLGDKVTVLRAIGEVFPSLFIPEDEKFGNRPDPAATYISNSNVLINPIGIIKEVDAEQPLPMISLASGASDDPSYTNSDQTENDPQELDPSDDEPQ